MKKYKIAVIGFDSAYVHQNKKHSFSSCAFCFGRSMERRSRRVRARARPDAPPRGPLRGFGGYPMGSPKRSNSNFFRVNNGGFALYNFIFFVHNAIPKNRLYPCGIAFQTALAHTATAA